jgi:protein-glutamine gamma-glutamyltransferase
MPSDAVFRLSLYLTLAFACMALGYAEYELLPEVPFVAAGVLIALAVIYRLETRVELLSIPAANRLGLFLGLTNLLWMVFRLVREQNSPQLVKTDWSLLLVALLGPLLMVLIPAKLARREKHAGDYWSLHAVALVACALAGAMAEDPIAFVLIACYAALAVWNLKLFYLARSAGTVLPVPGKQQATEIQSVVTGARSRFGLVWTGWLLLVSAAISLPLYLLVPRSPGGKLEFGKPRVEIGYAADQMIDLTQTGELEANTEVAFEVSATVNDKPMFELSVDQRWRGRELRRYMDGRWEPGDMRLPSILPQPTLTSRWPPSLGPKQITLRYSIRPGVRGTFLADPVAWAPKQATPIASPTPTGMRPWLWVGDGSFFSDIRAGNLSQYTQVWLQGDPPDLSPPFRLADPNPREVIRPLIQNPIPKVKEYADALITQLVRDGRLPENYLDPATFLPRREHHLLIAHSFTAHLSGSPSLIYTTELRRERKDIDPIEDFLFHTRAGHCERFATALTLLLRSQGIPAILVLGFKGCEPTTQPGRYIVRQENAHAWVECLIEEYEPSPQPGMRPISRWLSLDPTPSGSGPAATPAECWVGRSRAWVRARFREYIANYTAEQRQKSLSEIVKWLSRTEILVTLGASVVAMLFVPALLRRRRTWIAHRSHGWFDDLLAVLLAHGFRMNDGETAVEFATRVGEVIGLNPATVAVAEVPLEWAEAYYETRFGGTLLELGRQTRLESRLQDLKQALAKQ